MKAILSLVEPTAIDTIVTLGDYIDGGSDSRGVLETLLELSRRCTLIPLLGNHEEILLAVEGGRLDPTYWLESMGKKTIKSYGGEGIENIPKEHWDFLRACRRYHETDTHLFIHANYHPNQPMSQQPNGALLWEPIDLHRAARHYSGKTVIVGHTVQEGGHILDLGFLKCIDTGCGYGGILTALDVHEGTLWQVDEAGQAVP